MGDGKRGAPVRWAFLSGLICGGEPFSELLVSIRGDGANSWRTGLDEDTREGACRCRRRFCPERHELANGGQTSLSKANRSCLLGNHERRPQKLRRMETVEKIHVLSPRVFVHPDSSHALGFAMLSSTYRNLRGRVPRILLRKGPGGVDQFGINLLFRQGGG